MAEDPRVHVTFRSGRKGVDWIDALAERTATTRSRVFRACLAVARRRENEVVHIIEQWKDEQ